LRLQSFRGTAWQALKVFLFMQLENLLAPSGCLSLRKYLFLYMRLRHNSIEKNLRQQVLKKLY
jgi:hypothetical protein